jgi:hypothetical protein
VDGLASCASNPNLKRETYMFPAADVFLAFISFKVILHPKMLMKIDVNMIPLKTAATVLLFGKT